MDYYDRYSRDAAALQYISECISGQPKMRMYYGMHERVRGIRHLKANTLHKVIGILQHKNFEEGRFLSEICAGTDGPVSYAKARIDSLYHFMPIAEKYGITAGHLYSILRGLPHNRKRFVNCWLPVRRNEVEAFLIFTIELLKTEHRRGISVIDNREIRLNSPELCALVIENKDDLDRLIQLYCHEGIPIGRVKECLAAPLALQEGAL